MKKLGLFLGLFVCALMIMPFTYVNAVYVDGEGTIGYEGSGVTSVKGEDGVYTLTLTADADEDLIIRNGEVVVLDLAGYNFTNYAANNSAILIENGGSLTIKDSKGNGTISRKDISSAPTVNNQGILTVEGGVISANGEKSAALHNTGTLTFKGGKITTEADNVFGLVNEGVTLIEGGIFEQAHNFSVINNAGKMTVNDGTFTITDGNDKAYSLITNQSTDGSATLSVTGGTFKANGSVFFNDGKDSVSVSGGTFSDDVTDYLAEGYEMTKDNDGNFVLTKEDVTTPAEEEKPDVKDEVENPKTSDGIILVVGTLTLSAGAIVIAKKKLA